VLGWLPLTAESFYFFQKPRAMRLQLLVHILVYYKTQLFVLRNFNNQSSIVPNIVFFQLCLTTIYVNT